MGKINHKGQIGEDWVYESEELLGTQFLPTLFLDFLLWFWKIVPNLGYGVDPINHAQM